MAAYTTIDNPELYFQTKLYTGTGSAQSITLDGDENMQPDWVWCKVRSQSDNHAIFDSVRGGQKQLRSNSTDAELTRTNAISSFDSDGWSMGSQPEMNSNTETYVAWCWKAGTSFTNDASATSIGSIDSAGSFSNDSGISIVSYTGTGSNGTVKHGLSTAPKIIIFKTRTRSDLDWNVGSDMLGWGNFININTNSAQQTHNLFQDTAPTSSIFYLSGDAGVNDSGGNYIAYCFAEKQGFSSIGSYKGNASTNGTMVWTGTRPAYVIQKVTDTTSNWNVYDNKRNTFNPHDKLFYADTTSAEVTHTSMDFLSNGFKLRTTDGALNGSGNNYIYMAFAEAPFVNSKGVPCNAR